MSCSLPVLHSTEGGTREVVGECGVALGDDLTIAVGQMCAGYKEYVVRIGETWHTFSIEFAAARYIEVLKQFANA